MSAEHELVELVDDDPTFNADILEWAAYHAHGGRRSFEDWRATPCCACSKRHPGPELHRPPGETVSDGRQACLDALVRR